MKSVAKMTDAEYKATVRDLRQRAAGGKNTLGFYIQLMFLAGAAVTIVANGAWRILWGLLAFLGVIVAAVRLLGAGSLSIGFLFAFMLFFALLTAAVSFFNRG